jgi:hypothetical protein
MIADALAEQGLDVPPDLHPAEVWPVSAPYQDAFRVLSASRRQGFSGWEALAYSEVVAYAREHGYAESIDELDEFVALIHAQDNAFLEESAKQAKARRR